MIDGRGQVRRLAGVRRRLADGIRRLGRDVGVIRYRPEQWSDEQWAEAYGGHQLDYYGDLPELGRYSAVTGYVGWFAREHADRAPSVLDVGCGTGLLRSRLEGLPLATYTGVDISPAAITAAEAAAWPRSRFVVGDIAAAADERFDLVVVNEVLYYLPDAGSFLDDAAALLQPGGMVIVSMWRHPGDRFLWRTVGEHLTVVDRVEVRNRWNPANRRGWSIALCRPRSVPAGDRGGAAH